VTPVTVDDERPLTARSVLASLLLGTEPPWLSTPVLLRGAALFGIAEGATRTALSRMVAAGEAVAEGSGYRLRGRLLDRHARQRTSRLAEVQDWSGQWRMAVVASGARPAAERAELRAAMTTLRLAELRDGVWLRPDNLVGWPTGRSAAIVAAQCRWLSAAPDEDPVQLAAGLWDLVAWARQAEVLLKAGDVLRPQLEGGDKAALAPGFVQSANVLRHLQADPLLPPELQPDGWPGAPLRQSYSAFDRAYRTVLADWLRGAR
jgi:phenylacetic acid degradation operon negative regulatory protein